MILEVSRKFFASIQASFQLSVCDVAGYDNSTLQVNASTYRIFAQLCTYRVNTLIQVYFDSLSAFTRLTQFFGYQFRRIAIHLFKPDTVFINFSLDVTVGRATNTHTDRTACSVARQTNHADIVCQVLTAELSSKTNLVSFFEQFVFQVNIAECTSGFVACSRQVIVIFNRSEFNCKQVLLCAGTTDNECDVIRRTSCSTQCFHLFYQERKQCAFILDSSLSHRVEVSLVGRTTTLSNHYKAVFVAFGSLDVDLSRQVATSVYFIVHVKRSVLRVAQIIFCKCVVHTAAQRFFIFEVGPYTLSFFSVDNGSTGILAERQNAFCGSFCITKELQCYVLVVFRSFGV